MEAPKDAPFHLGSFSHPGPATVAADKGNQDFAFHVHLPGPNDKPWALFGVADGVSSGSWSARAARHAAASFIETVHGFLGDPDFPRSEDDLLDARWHEPLSTRFHNDLMRRLRSDVDFLLAARHVDPTWAPTLFAQQFFDAPDAERRVRTSWMQTTLLAAALGPHGGFALLLGDGFVRVDREHADGSWELASGLEPTRQISLELTEAHVRSCVRRLPGKGAVRLGLVVTTDGVSKSSTAGLDDALRDLETIESRAERPPLDRVRFHTSLDCQRALDRLAALPPTLADADNMSIAFGVRDLDPARKR
jgi:hypothetical protein